ncbi:hypothetical protein [Neoaquamicrobium microcysteis]|nr:hypothetical protein [Mesorhizobium microcysteis]
MPTETIITLGGIIAAFAFFAAVLTFADMTWDRGGKSLPRR